MNKQTNSSFKGCVIFWLSFLGGVFFQFIVISIIAIIFGKSQSETSLLSNIYITLVAYLALYGGMFAICYFTHKPQKVLLKKISPLKVLIYSSIAAATFFMLTPFINIINTWLSSLGLTQTPLEFELTTTNYFIAIIFLVLLPAIVEELLFRGAIFSNMSKHGKTFASITTTLIFSFFHSSIFQTIYPILFGLLLCVIIIREQNIYYCMIAHAINNFLALTSSFLNWPLFSTKAWYVILAFVLATIYISILIFSLTKAISKNTNKEAKTPLTAKDKLTLTFTFIALIGMLIFSIFS